MTVSRKQLGISLIELSVVLVIVGVITAMATIPFASTGSSLNSQADRLASDIRYVQFLSMSLNERFRINFASGQYTFTELDGVTPIYHPSTGSSVENLDSGIALTIPVNVTNNYIVFDSKGKPYVDDQDPGDELVDTATFTLQLGGQSKQIVITPETGKVTIQ